MSTSLEFTGPPKILEGDKGFFAAACPDAIPSAVTASSQAPWELMQTSIKPWPCCRHTHPSLDAALDLHGELNGAEIEKVDVETYQAVLDVCDRPLVENEYEARFSLQHTVAVALRNGNVNFQSFAPEVREELASLRQKISIAAAEPWVSAYPVSWGARVTVTTNNGSEHKADRAGARGDPELALDDNEMLEKAHMLLEFGGCNRADSRRIIDGIVSLPTGGSDIVTFLRDQFN